MANQAASKDENFVPSLIAVLNTNGTTITPAQATPSTHVLHISDGTSGTDLGPSNALRDLNDVPTLVAVSNADGITPVPIYSDSSGKLLVQST